MNIPDNIRKIVLNRFCNLPYKERGIQINEELIIITIEILNENESKILPQNARNVIMEKTPHGLDKIIKQRLNTNTRTANIISDILENKGFVEIIKIKNEKGNYIKATKLLNEFTW